MNNTQLSLYEYLSLEQNHINFILSLVVFLVTFISVLLAYVDYRNRKSKEKAEKAIEIAKDFALNVVKPLSNVHTFFKIHNINNIISKVNFINLEDFDISELKTLYSENDINDYNNIFIKADPNRDMKKTICNILNILEYQSMYISTKVADEKYIYNSLHQQFFKSIALLYFEISSINVDDKDKYYTNIINLYNLWKKKYLKYVKKEEMWKKFEKKLKKIKKFFTSPKNHTIS